MSPREFFSGVKCSPDSGRWQIHSGSWHHFPSVIHLYQEEEAEGQSWLMCLTHVEGWVLAFAFIINFAFLCFTCLQQRHGIHACMFQLLKNSKPQNLGALLLAKDL